MKLTYRGTTYDYTPPQVEMEPSAIVGKYRGLEWRFRNPKRVPVLESNLDLMYRGVPYHSETPAIAPVADVTVSPSVVEPVTTTPIGVSVQNMARSLMLQHHRWIKNRQQSLLARSATEVGMDIDAAHYWSTIQGKPTAESGLSYDRSSVAMS
jgi:hypothetical protein